MRVIHMSQLNLSFGERVQDARERDHQKIRRLKQQIRRIRQTHEIRPIAPIREMQPIAQPGETLQSLSIVRPREIQKMPTHGGLVVSPVIRAIRLRHSPRKMRKMDLGKHGSRANRMSHPTDLHQTGFQKPSSRPKHLNTQHEKISFQTSKLLI